MMGDERELDLPNNRITKSTIKSAFLLDEDALISLSYEIDDQQKCCRMDKAGKTFLLPDGWPTIQFSIVSNKAPSRPATPANRVSSPMMEDLPASPNEELTIERMKNYVYTVDGIIGCATAIADNVLATCYHCIKHFVTSGPNSDEIQSHRDAIILLTHAVKNQKIQVKIRAYSIEKDVVLLQSDENLMVDEGLQFRHAYFGQPYYLLGTPISDDGHPLQVLSGRISARLEGNLLSVGHSLHGHGSARPGASGGPVFGRQLLAGKPSLLGIVAAGQSISHETMLLTFISSNYVKIISTGTLHDAYLLSEKFKKQSLPKQMRKNKINTTFEDPLGATFGAAEHEENVDRDILNDSTKLRSLSLDNTLESRKTDRQHFDVELPDFQSWREKRAQIASLAKPREFVKSEIEMLRTRLKEITDEKNPQTVIKVADFSKKFIMYRENMVTAWGRENRVEAFKVLIESTHFMQSIPPPSEEFTYYWLLAMEVIDTFGKLVYDRLLSKSNEARNKNGQTDLPPKFTVEQVPKNVKDMAMNWFLKLSEIVDIPVRFYIECSMIACLKFFDDTNISVNLERLAFMCSQFPDDISSIFARVHLSRYSMHTEPLNRTPHWRVLHDWMQAPKDIMKDVHRRKESLTEARKQAISIQAISWIVQCIAHGALTVSDLVPLFAYCRRTSPVDEKTFILVSAIVEGLPSKYLAVHSEQVLDIVFALREDFEEPLTRLGKRYLAMPPIEENRKFVKNPFRSVWMRVADISNFKTFVDCCAAWTSYISKYYTLKDVNKILDLVLIRLKIDDQTKNPENISILIDLVASFIEFNADKTECLDIVTKSSFIKVVDLIGHDIQSTSNCSKRILEIFTKRFGKNSISSHSVGQFIVEKCRSVCKTYRLDDSDEEKMIERLVCSSISLIDFKRIPDMNQSIELIVRCREEMGLRQIILSHIINILLEFTQYVHSSMKSGKRRADFMRKCITTLSLTIPAIRDSSKRVKMTVQNIQLCLLANFIPQIEMSSERIIDYIDEINSNTTSPCTTISPLVNQFLSVLCYCPDGFSEDSSSLTHFSKLLAITERSHEDWSKESKGVPLAEIYINMLRYLCNCRRIDPLSSDGTQDFHVGDEEYLSSVDSNISDVITKLFSLANEPTIAVITLENVVMLFEMHEEMRSTIRGLLKRAVGAPPPLQKRLDSIIQDLRNEAESDENVHNILQRLSLL
uniref:Serine protease n=1 Tax=Caenorhabditis tropicalis TaxID=1561998 RepID=A0A1I7TRY9_9PELO